VTVQDILNGNRRALARFLTKVENNHDSVRHDLAELFPYSANSHIIGVTGAPGTGKSSLVTSLTKRLRDTHKTVAILAVDPTSPFSGGAILGDRIRMRALSGDEGVMIRSMATRGSLGGLASTTQDMVRVLSSAGYDVVIVETVGAGQSEVDIMRISHTTIVVEAPGLGDGVQAIKAGILEIADILVVNKGDLAGADKTERALKSMLELGHPTKYQSHDIPMWFPPIVCTSTKNDTGLDHLLETINDHHKYINQHDYQSILVQDQATLEFNKRLKDSLFKRFVETVEDDTITGIIKRITQYEIDPQQAVDELLRELDFSIRDE
jgi:LAO/AO transport system kinase